MAVMTAREILREQGRSVTWAARRVGVDRGYLSHMVRGTRPMPEHVARQLAAILGVPVEFLAERPAPIEVSA